MLLVIKADAGLWITKAWVDIEISKRLGHMRELSMHFASHKTALQVNAQRIKP